MERWSAGDSITWRIRVRTSNARADDLSLELEWAVDAGRYTPAEVEDLRREGERAVTRLRTERRRFERWLAWRPDPWWPLATLPIGWDDA